MIKEIKVTDRVLILGVDYLYREFMKKYESGALLESAKSLVSSLDIAKGSYQVEGYYTESPELSEYFNLIQSLKTVEYERLAEVEGSEDYKRIIKVFTSPIYGKYKFERSIIPQVDDPINTVMRVLDIPDWNAKKIMSEARKKITDSDFSLTVIALLIDDPIVVAALRESVVLYLDMVALSGLSPEIPEYKYTWNVSKEVEDKVNLFIDEFNRFPAEKIRTAFPPNGEYFYNAYLDNKILGRCVRVGIDISTPVKRYYHWAVGFSEDSGGYQFKEFWDEKVWTTEMFRGELGW